MKKLSVESFRGFTVSRDFNLNKKYVFLYGPNGSGKSSFSEALEYGLLNIIQEADANKIKLSVYIKNTSTKRERLLILYVYMMMIQKVGYRLIMIYIGLHLSKKQNFGFFTYKCFKFEKSK